MARTIGYARVSTTEQHTDAQVDRLRQAGAEPVFVDHGESGAKASRPQWDKCLAELREGDVLLSTRLDRFGRSVAHLVEVIPALVERGIVVRCLDQPIDTQSASGRMLFTILAAFAEFERNLLRERIRDANKFNARNGKVSRQRSFGFENGEIVESEAAVIRECAERLLAGETQDAILADLRERGIPTVHGADWSYTVFRQVMTRPKVAGIVTHDGLEVARLPGEPILDEGTFRRLVALYSARRPGRPPSGRYMLTGLLVCGLCDARLVGRPVTGTKTRQYWCKKCSHCFIDAARLEDWAGEYTCRTLADPRHVDAIARAQAAEAEQHALLRREAADIEKVLTEIGGRLGRQEISLARHDAICDPLDKRLAELRDELAGHRGRQAGAAYWAWPPCAAQAVWVLASGVGRCRAGRAPRAYAACAQRRAPRDWPWLIRPLGHRPRDHRVM